MIITPEKWKELTNQQSELEQLVVKKSPFELKWVSRFNAERLKLALLVEVGEFANEIKSFKAWAKKTAIDKAKAKVELIDCLCFFFGLVNVYRIDMTPALLKEYKKTDLSFDADSPLNNNKVLLEFFTKTSELYIEKNEEFYNSNLEIKEKNIYYEWLRIFDLIGWKLQINEQELINIYAKKYDKNLERVHAK